MSKPTILIVDDEAKFLNSLSLLLKRDFNVLKALNGEEGLSAFKSNRKISLILLDLKMQVMNGVEMLQRIRESGSNIKVLIMTGNSNHGWAKECANLTIQGYLEKPFDTEELIERIKKLLDMSKCEVLEKIWGENYELRMKSVNQAIKRAFLYIEKNIHRNFDRNELSSHLKIAPDYLSRVFRNECGIQLQNYINLCRIEKSLEYLTDSDGRNVDEIAGLVGLSDPNYFSRLFKQQKGMTPAEYKKNHISPTT